MLFLFFFGFFPPRVIYDAEVQKNSIWNHDRLLFMVKKVEAGVILNWFFIFYFLIACRMYMFFAFTTDWMSQERERWVQLHFILSLKLSQSLKQQFGERVEDFGKSVAEICAMPVKVLYVNMQVNLYKIFHPMTPVFI